MISEPQLNYTPGSTGRGQSGASATGEVHERRGRKSQYATRASHADALPLQVEGVVVRFGGIAALNGATIEVGSREIVGLIGPNGAGKTTLMNTISGVLRPDQGSVRLFGHETASLSPNVRARYGLARSFQDASLFAGLTVTETVQVAMMRRDKTLPRAGDDRRASGAES